ncbi:MAG: hypothetical protein LBC31_02715 [Treponema sp.]|jgi:hypothetical protein|nr:hypothetical protein [Treponema sp.]
MKANIRRLTLCLAAAWAVFYGGCDQEPLFWDISQEYPPIEPIIEGAPSQIVECSGMLYVSNGDVWEYNGNWHKIDQPGAQIKVVASITASTGGSNERLFALSWAGTLYERNGSGWKNHGDVGAAEQLFGAGDNLFIGVLTGTAGAPDGYKVVIKDASGSMGNSLTTVTEISGTGLLRGAATDGSDTYFGTSIGGGVYKVGSPLTLVVGDPVIGLFNDLSNTVYAVTNGGTIISDVAGTPARMTSDFRFSGALAGWDHKGGGMLLLGLQRSSGSYGYGYRELRLSAGGIVTPGSSAPSSVEIDSQYTSAIGEHAVTSIYVLAGSNSGDNDGRPIIFACTAKDGLWSYRVRDGRAQWNGEDNGN